MSALGLLGDLLIFAIGILLIAWGVTWQGFVLLIVGAWVLAARITHR